MPRDHLLYHNADTAKRPPPTQKKRRTKTLTATGGCRAGNSELHTNMDWSVRRQRPYHHPDKLFLPFGTKCAV